VNGDREMGFYSNVWFGKGDLRVKDGSHDADRHRWPQKNAGRCAANRPSWGWTLIRDVLGAPGRRLGQGCQGRIPVIISNRKAKYKRWIKFVSLMPSRETG